MLVYIKKGTLGNCSSHKHPAVILANQNRPALPIRATHRIWVIEPVTHLFLALFRGEASQGLHGLRTEFFGANVGTNVN